MPVQIPPIISDFSAYIDGILYKGSITEVVPPKLATKIAEINTGFMPYQQAVGIEPMETTLTMHDLDVNAMTLFAKAPKSSMRFLSGAGRVLNATNQTSAALGALGIATSELLSAPGTRSITIRSSAVVGNTEISIVLQLEGWAKEIDTGTWQAGEKADIKFTLVTEYFRYIRDGLDVLEIDPANYILKVGEHDVLKKRRENLGV